MEEEGRSRAIKAARSLGERSVTELILQHQNPQQLSANLWAAVRARGCQFLGDSLIPINGMILTAQNICFNSLQLEIIFRSSNARRGVEIGTIGFGRCLCFIKKSFGYVCGSKT